MPTTNDNPDPNSRSMDPPSVRHQGSVPVPDPTRLTTDAISSAMLQWHRDQQALREILETRLDASDKAVELNSLALQQSVESQRREIATLLEGRHREVDGLQKLIEEKFAGVDVTFQSLTDLFDEKFEGVSLRFKERDDRTDQAARAAKEALDAALLAAKELVGQQNEANAAVAVKSEVSFTKQIDQIGVTILNQQKAFDDRLTELKERIDRGEGNQRGSSEQRSETRQSSALITSVAVGAIVFFGLIASLIGLVLKK